MESKVKDPVNDGYIESFTREWGTPQKLGYDGDGIAAKTMNTHIHVLEAYTAYIKYGRITAFASALQSNRLNNNQAVQPTNTSLDIIL